MTASTLKTPIYPKPCGVAQANAVSDKILDLRLCDYSGKDLSGKTLSGALLENAKLPNTNLREVVMSKVGHYNGLRINHDVPIVGCWRTPSCPTPTCARLS